MDMILRPTNGERQMIMFFKYTPEISMNTRFMHEGYSALMILDRKYQMYVYLGICVGHKYLCFAPNGAHEV